MTPPDAREREWLLRLSEWVPSVWSELPGEPACSAGLDDYVGPAPTRRLKRLELLAQRACGRMERAPRSQAGLRLVDDLVARMSAYERASGDARPLPTIAGRSGRSRVEPRLGRALTELTGRPTEVRCWSRADWRVLTEAWPHVRLEGYAHGDERVHLVNAVCGPLVELYRGRRPADLGARLRLAWAINVLAHEGEHRAGVANEATAQCYAMQRLAGVARSLGAPAALARSLAQLMWSDLYATMPPEYRSSRCRDGGRLDLRPSSAIWP